MFEFNQVQNQQMDRVDALEREVSQIYETLVLPNWDGPLHGFPETLYGLMMAVFSRFDILSAYWKGDGSTKGQTARMAEFLETFLRHNTEANGVAIQMWRHKLMHTSQPRYLLDESTGKPAAEQSGIIASETLEISSVTIKWVGLFGNETKTRGGKSSIDD